MITVTHRVLRVLRAAITPVCRVRGRGPARRSVAGAALARFAADRRTSAATGSVDRARRDPRRVEEMDAVTIERPAPGSMPRRRTRRGPAPTDHPAGSTGSIGTQALDVIAAHPEAFEVVGLAAGGAHPELFAAQAAAHPDAAARRRHADPDRRLAAGGRRAHRRRGPPPSWSRRSTPTSCSTASPGRSASSRPWPRCEPAGSWRWPTRNRWSRVGPLVTGRGRAGADRAGRFRAQRAGPVPARRHRRRGRAAGGHRIRWPVPWPHAQPRWPTSPPTEALAHPTWAMGPVVTINSATLVNKGLEVIEAHLLFGIPYDRIEVVVHPQSVIHSMVTFVDGSTLAQASPPDMKLPIALALGWPHRLDRVAAACDFSAAGRAGRSNPSIGWRSPRWTWRSPPGRPAAPSRRRSTRPTRRRSMPSVTVTCVSQASRTFCPASWTRPITCGATRGMSSDVWATEALGPAPGPRDHRVDGTHGRRSARQARQAAVGGDALDVDRHRHRAVPARRCCSPSPGMSSAT